ncbi:polyprenyl synthetase family protein [Streptomyces samsunensis]|uniref:polyprenyl synthetase family protein n=1 Tax=Streptomyces malaysiensis TaxID=92644 RepID=UPI001582E3F9|nr:polyprenyl synthetase family protein [Streptomyces samsunensis]NUH35443.1 polyprenyl synthetase family protein [Streptomyces samsunensis]
MVASARTEPRGSMAMELTIGDPTLMARLERGMDASEERLRALAAEARDPYVAEVAGHLFGRGGKRLRPLLALVGAEFGERRPERRPAAADPSAAGASATGTAATDPSATDAPAAVDATVDAAALAELVHVASLFHDDVMDQGLTRRGVPSVNARWGNTTAVLAGNWLLSKAAQLAAELGPETIRLQSKVTNRLIMGQIRELVGPSDDDDPLSHYFTVVAGKTAALIAMALQLGAVRTGAPDRVVQALAEYGEHLGIAFQISDDILDVTSTSEVSGKEQGKDLAIGVASLPVLLALADERPEAGELRTLLTAATAAAEGTGLPKAVALLHRCGALAEARTVLHARLLRARTALNGLPDGPATQVLHALCDFVARRDH